MELMDYFLNEIQDFADELLVNYQLGLTQYNAIATGNLLDTSIFKAIRDNEVIYLNASLPEYWKYVEYGRKAGGKYPPRKAIENWIKVKNIQPYPDKNGMTPTTQQLAFLICRSIAINGIQPKNLLLNALKKTISEYADKFGKNNIDITQLVVNDTIAKNVKIIIDL